jgi:L-histidine N-alpha-methyltransferase
MKQDSVALNVVRDVESEREAQVIAGLEESPPRISPIWFYDQLGSALFERICALPEYYPTRTELDIMRRHAGDIAAALGERVTLIEPGSGASVKTRLLLDALHAPVAYVPVDISRTHLLVAAARLRRDYPQLRVRPICADFTAALDVPTAADHGAHRRVVYFPGSTLGNFALDDAVSLLARFADAAGPDGAVLLGLDRVKSRPILERAYNDGEGVTAAFNLNALRHLNRELGATFDLKAFDHRASWLAEQERIEMHLVSRRDQAFSVGAQCFRLARGEYLLTEYSHKYTLESASNIAACAGLSVRQVWSDAREWFSVLLLEPA